MVGGAITPYKQPHIHWVDSPQNRKLGLKHICTPKIFTIAKTWKQPKCPLKDEWINKMWYVCSM